MLKHAYLVMAHNNFYVLETLLHLLDDERNTIYLHIDKKTKGVDTEALQKIPQKAKLYLVKRRKVNWGGFSQIQCELALLREAVKGKHNYYHYLSGVDLPIKPNNTICKRIEENNGKLFINFSEDEFIQENHILERMELYHFFQEYLRRKQKWIAYPARALERVSLWIQKRLKVNRLRGKNIEIKYGANWVSIPHAFAEYVLSQKKEITSYFRFSNCCDEIFMQTLAYNSEFRKDIYDIDRRESFHSCLRSIDWKRGTPYIYRLEDFEPLIQSEFLFARKFDQNVDRNIVDKLKEYLEKENGKKV